MDFYFESFLVERDDKKYLFPAGKVFSNNGGYLVFDEEGRPYAHPFTYSTGCLDVVEGETLDSILLCKVNRPPIKPLNFFVEYLFS